MQKITTFLTFKDQAEEALNFYLSVFRNGKIINTVHTGDKENTLFTATVELWGIDFER